MIIWPDICECVATLGEKDGFLLGYKSGNGWYITSREFLDQNWDIPAEGWGGLYEDLRDLEDPILMRKGLMRW